MRGQPDLFGEIHEGEEEEILKIACEAVKKRGYAIYAHFNEFMTRKMGEPPPAPADIGYAQKRIEVAIMATLVAYKWVLSWGGRERRFYPPSTEFPNLWSKDEATP